MTIKDEKQYKTITFNKLLCGQVFFNMKDGCHYLCIPEVDDRNAPKIYNAFNLETNMLAFFNYEDEVILRQAELHLI